MIIHFEPQQILTALILSFVMVMFYFRLADQYNIIDKPNQRSSHTQITLRGAGIIFPVMFLLNTLNFLQEINLYFLFGLLLISILSFWDDVKELSPQIRIVFQAISIVLLLWQLPLSFPFAFFYGFIILGVINSYNFMDGINGITVLYSSVTAASVLWGRHILGIGNIWYDDSLFQLFSAFAAFAYFNLRKRAKCFSGDIGAISMAFILCYGILEVVINTSNPIYILLLGVYGLDSVATIVFRICRREKLTQAHRSHLYQYWANEKGIPHVWVSMIYATVQLCLSAVVVYAEWYVALLVFGVLVSGYLMYRFRSEGAAKLLTLNK
jgi:UDP-GlcNAc:undecaprenyl-phosphate GlcNAc-1-phosphate transferase